MTHGAEFRLVQVSDCHLLPAPDARYRGVPALPALRGVLDAARRWQPQALLLSGDLAEDGSEDSYALLAAALRDVDCPAWVLPGNHDEPDLLRARWAHGPWQGPLALDAGAWRVVLLDSTVPGEPSGRLDGETLDALDDELSCATDTPTLVALHHQPLPVGSPWIDRYPLNEADAFRARLAAHPQVRIVSWGHVHQAWRQQRDGVCWVSAPSSVANALPWRNRFEPDPGGPACRWFRLGAGGGFATGVLRPAPISGPIRPASPPKE